MAVAETTRPERADLHPKSGSEAIMPDRPARPIYEYDLAIASGEVTLDQVVETNYRRLHYESEEEFQSYAYYYPRLLERFNAQHQPHPDQPHGNYRAYFARNTESAVILTKNEELHVRVSTTFLNDTDLIRILSQLTLLHLQAREFLSGDDFRICMDPVFNVIAFCLQSIDSLSQGDPGGDNKTRTRLESAQQAEVQRVLEIERNRAETDFYKVLQRNALVRYFYGMLAGVALLVTIGIVLSFIETGVFGLGNEVFAVVVAAGSIGAFVSVLTRISSGRFSLSRGTLALQQAKRKAMMMWVLGAFRPVIGAVFATAFVIFQNSGLIPVQPAKDVTLATYYAGVAFIAGFSERWAQDMVVSTRTTLFEPRLSSEVESPSGLDVGQRVPADKNE